MGVRRLKLPQLTKTVSYLMGYDSVLRLALSHEYWQTDEKVKNYVEELCAEWINKKFDYMEDANKQFDTTIVDNNEWINLTKINSSILLNIE